MNLDYVTGLRFQPTEQRYDWRDSALYALSLGMATDPLDEDELLYVYEGRGPQAVPCQCVTLGWQPYWQMDPRTGIDWVRMLHGEIGFTLHQALPVQAHIRTEHALVAVEDKGVGRGALCHQEHRLFNQDGGAHLATVRSVLYLRGDGGCGNWGVAPPGCAEWPAGLEPTGASDVATTTQGALFYRLTSRDLMPIHADPDTAREAGFERPISHGLHTLGRACRVLLKRFAPGCPQRLVEMSVRFVRPAFPGDTLRVEWIEVADLVRFRVRAIERDVLLLDRGSARILPA